MTEAPPLEPLARRAVAGDREALNDLVTAVQPRVYALALRMLWNRQDAEDATQDILVRVVTRLAQFDFRSRLTTWVYRVAVNHLLDVKKSPVERLRLTFESFADDLAQGLEPQAPGAAERSVLVEEVKVGCTLAMLQCLDRPHRLAYIVGEILDTPGPEAANILQVSPDAFRKQLQRARAEVVAFTRAHCGLVSDAVACACHRRVNAARAAGRVHDSRLDFADRASSFAEAKAAMSGLEEAQRVLALHRVNAPRAATRDFARELLDRLA
jgi:RNA polymerase sigma factor (sigma-70 family)